MSHIPYYDEESQSFTNNEDMHVVLFGPWSNRHGDKLELGIIDDCFMLKVLFPNGAQRITYHYDEDSLVDQVDMYSQRRYY